MSSLRRTMVRAACRKALADKATKDDRFWAKQAHKRFKIWWRERDKLFAEVLAPYLHNKFRKMALLGRNKLPMYKKYQMNFPGAKS